MKISRDWLQTFFEASLPDAATLADALTFHAFEIEGIENDILDIKVTPNRGHDCLSYRGIAKEVSAILDVPMKSDPLRTSVSLEPKTDTVKISIENPELCRRFTGAYIKNIRVGPSPEWLQKRLETMGQKSINNVVDATNFVMFDMGQPLHAFDAGKLAQKNGGYSLIIHSAKNGETMLGLDEKEYALNESILAIADGNTGEAVSIAGIKGGMPTGIDEKTTDMILEAANWDGVTIRKTSQALKLRTDASQRFEQVISPEFSPFGLKAAAEMIMQLAGGEIVGFVDEYPRPQIKKEVRVSVQEVNGILGTEFTAADVENVFKRLGFSHIQTDDVFTITAPFERLDLVIPEDLVEEVGRIMGYDKVPATPLPAFPQKPEINKNFYAAERIREDLMSKGYSEVYTSVFADNGERVIANKVDGVRPFLRTNLDSGLGVALTRNVRNKYLLGLDTVKLFEIGSVWKDGQETMMVATHAETSTTKDGLTSADMSEKPLATFIAATPEQYDALPLSELERYQQFSRYPFIVRDIALWVPAATTPETILDIIRKSAGELLVRSEKFDEFKKGDKTSYAFRLIFQSFDRTLTDGDANQRMESVSAALKKEGYEIR
jgi:phenylalanyl-tRNA synthetase beta chain